MLKISDGAAPATFLPLTGFRSTGISLRAETVDGTHLQSPGWREQVASAGLSTARISARGLFTGDAGILVARDAFFARTSADWQITVPGLGTLQGPFRLTRFDLTGPYTGEINLSLTLQSAGEITLDYTETQGETP
ncbi:MAG: phage major tail protein, TP901-1 family [Aquisalinus sp.]|nr:phage major tail protein, TP901-1 family [Aquisalinus sp.]